MAHRHVRSLSRGLKIIQELNVVGRSTVQELANRTGLHRTTCYRILQTLQHEGYALFDEELGNFALTQQVRSLSCGISSKDVSSRVALSEMQVLVKEVSWPSDFAVFDQGAMQIEESTHSHSQFSIHRSMVGRKRSLVRSALGRAVLAAAHSDLRNEMLKITAALVPEDALLAGDKRYIEQIVAITKGAGYASSVDESEAGISAIGLAVCNADVVIGSLNLIFFSKAMSPALAAAKYLPNMRRVVDRIQGRLVRSDGATSFNK